MTQYVISLAQAIDELNLIGTRKNAAVDRARKAASTAVLNYCDKGSFEDSSGEIPEDSAGDPIVPEPVYTAAVLLLHEFFYGADSSRWERGYLPTPVIGLLYPYRTPTIA